ncbi:hypothetical protein VNO80_24326 [Phaseolus coccineus]|uniref:Uncharacterized protein n=1 Tax=Phaseolus coccineus TaxID=3886 RepID=A0AAN9LSK8_PHACN
MVVEVVEMVAVVEVAIMKGTIRRRNSRANQIGVEEDVVEEEDCNSDKCYNCAEGQLQLLYKFTHHSKLSG